MFEHRFRVNTEKDLQDWVQTLPETLLDVSVFKHANSDRADFTYDSFQQVDKWLRESFPNGEFDSPKLQPMLTWFAAYAGETFRRHYDGCWLVNLQPGAKSHGLILLECSEVVMDIWGYCEDAIAGKYPLVNRIPKMATTTVATSKNEFAHRLRITCENELRDWIQIIHDFLANDSVFEHAGSDLVDFSFESFHQISSWLSDAFPDGKFDAAELQPLLTWFAVYIGETYRRDRGGEWDAIIRPGDRFHGLLILKLANGNIVEPWGIIERAIAGKFKLEVLIPPTESVADTPSKPDRYEIVVMPKQGVVINKKWFEKTVNSAATAEEATAKRTGDSFRIEGDGGYLRIDYQSDEFVAAESDEMSEMLRDPSCAGAKERYCFCGYDPKMALVNVFAFITEDLHLSGDFVLFDSVDCKNMFD